MFGDLMMILFFIVAVVLFLGTLAYGAMSAAPWVPLRKREVERIMLLAGVGEGTRFVDLGSGDGRIVVAAARRGAKATGYEVALLPFLYSYVKIKSLKLRNASVYMKNFFRISLEDADVTSIFLTPMAMKKIEPKLRKELRPGAKIVTCAFRIPGWTPEKEDKEEKAMTLYLYVKK